MSDERSQDDGLCEMMRRCLPNRVKARTFDLTKENVPYVAENLVTPLNP